MKSKARQNNEEYEANWKEYFSAIDPYIERQQIDQGGPIILYQIGKCEILDLHLVLTTLLSAFK